MKWGIGLSAAGVFDARALADLAALAEKSGWDCIFLEDYIIHWQAEDAPTYDPWICLAAMAMRTVRIRLGIIVTPLPRRRPWKVAREATTLDHQSNGRLILGVGAGGVEDPTNFDKFGETVDIRERGRMLDEALEIIAGLWSGEPFSFSGDFYHVHDVTFLPKPVQSPRIPIWIGGGWPLKGPTERAARWDGSCLYKHAFGGSWIDWTPDDIRTLSSFVEGRRRSSAPYDIAVGGRERNPDWEQERRYIRSIAEAGATWWMEYIEPTGFDETWASIERGPLHYD